MTRTKRRKPLIRKEKTCNPLRLQVFFLAGDEGFEPPQTESESGVLPLHKSPKWPLAEAHDYYNDFSQKVKTNFFFFAEIKTGRYGPLMVKE